jgi:membrane-associated protein
MVLGGYFLGKSIPHVDKYLHLIVLAIIVLSLMPIGYEYLKSKRRPHD